ncbi:unnamed protein product [Mytilus coruscus]|uniref:Exportin-T n=1 Tax=Mytilus coruscus TaxID=42192 RepID=A0A6J8DJS8_MYTCO|nr:unnamed protein product [Mytilus coruscus]
MLLISGCTLYFIKPRRHFYDCYYYPFAGMDEEALRGLNPISDPQLQRRALQYFEQLKSLESGWKLCAEAFVNGSYHGNDHVKFFCLQVIEHYLKTGYNLAILDDHQNIKSFIARCLQLQGSEGTQDRSFIRNKIAQIISLAFVHDYPHRWPSFFTDLLQTVSPNHHSIDIYLRVLLAIDSDVVDREIVHTPEEFQRNTLIKDAMREQAVGQLAGTWYEILTTYETSNPEVVCMCLDVIGKFISWIDINLIANDKFVTVLLNFMTLTLIRESACDCITDILNKGMDPIVKTKLVESFTNVLEERGILSPVEDEEGDFLAKLSKLVNAIGVNLILAWQKLLKTEDKENTEATLQALESKVPLMFRFLSDEDDDVSGAVAQFSQEYIALLKQMKPLSQKQRENMEMSTISCNPGCCDISELIDMPVWNTCGALSEIGDGPHCFGIHKSFDSDQIEIGAFNNIHDFEVSNHSNHNCSHQTHCCLSSTANDLQYHSGLFEKKKWYFSSPVNMTIDNNSNITVNKSTETNMNNDSGTGLVYEDLLSVKSAVPETSSEYTLPETEWKKQIKDLKRQLHDKQCELEDKNRRFSDYILRLEKKLAEKDRDISNLKDTIVTLEEYEELPKCGVRSSHALDGFQHLWEKFKPHSKQSSERYFGRVSSGTDGAKKCEKNTKRVVVQPISKEKTWKSITKNVGLLYIVIKKMTYDESYDFEHEGEEEAMFQEYRKQLKTIFNNLAALDAQLIIVTVHNILTQTLPNWERMDQLETELAISLLYQLGEALPATQGQHFSGDLTKASVLQEMMRLLITSRVSCQGHMSVMLQFFETVVRYDKFFSVEPQHIPDVLMAFTDERGFRHRSAQVRSRASYLFSRFVKGVRSHIHNYVEEILQRIQDLLVLNTPDNGYQHLLSSDDQLFLYETAGSLIVCSNLPSEKKQTLMKNLLSPIATKFESLLTKLVAESNQEKQLAYAQSINTATALASRVSKGFSSQQTMQVCGCVDTFTDLLRLFLQAVNVPIHRQLIHTGVRQYLHRMVVCMEKEILPFVPVVLENLLKQPDARELHDFLPLMNQMIMKFKSAISPFLQEVFMPLVSTIYQVLTTPTDELDQVTANDKKMLQRSYYLFICTIVCNDVLDVLKNQDMQNLNQVLITFIQGAVDIPDPQSQKMCFNILRKLVDSWGGNDGMAGFVDFMYKSIIPACLMAPMKPSFDLNDGQTSLALGECSNCLREIYGKRGDEMIQYLLSEYLPTLQLSQQQTEEFCQVLKADSKLFRTYFKNFFMKAKS